MNHELVRCVKMKLKDELIDFLFAKETETYFNCLSWPFDLFLAPWFQIRKFLLDILWQLTKWWHCRRTSQSRVAKICLKLENPRDVKTFHLPVISPDCLWRWLLTSILGGVAPIDSVTFDNLRSRCPHQPIQTCGLFMKLNALHWLQNMTPHVPQFLMMKTV